VVFSSIASNLVAGDTNGQLDVFVHDRQTGTTTRVSVDSSGNEANGDNWNGSISGDGRYVVIESSATNLATGDTNGVDDIFVHDRQTGTTTRVSVDSSGLEANAGSDSSSVSGDGRYVAFRSTATNLVAGDTNGVDDVFVHDRQTGQTTRISVDNSGAEGNGTSGFGTDISADGQYVAFRSTASNLVAGDTNGVDDVFVTLNSLASGGSSSSASFTLSLLSGVDVSTQTDALAAQDTIDDYLTEANAVAGIIGASVSRFQVAVQNLQQATENFRAAESRIVDADVAEEAAQLTKRRILQQAGAAVLAQANQQPQLALRLLKISPGP
jgi:flagellin-like hook-associated protein FlgL